MARTSRSLRVRLALIAVLVCAFVALGAGVAHAASISGTVRADASGDPIPYAKVDFFSDAGGYWDVWTWQTTGTDGAYTFDGLEPGVYTVAFYGGNGDYEYFGGVASADDATPIEIVDYAESLVGMDGSLDYAGYSIGGTITGSDGQRVPWATVNAYYFDGIDWAYYGATAADFNGRYAFYDLPEDNYRLEFLDFNSFIYLSEFYSDASDVYSATDVPVGAGYTAVCDAVLTAPPFLAGTVRDASTMDPIGGVWAGAHYYDGEYGWYDYGWGCTGADGMYSILGVEPGVEYAIYFDDENAIYANTWYPGEGHVGQATTVLATEEGVGGIDQTLIPWDQCTGTIEGTVYDASTTDGINGAWVDFLSEDGYGWQWWDGTTTDGAGWYSHEIFYGDYIVAFWADGYLEGYWEGVSTLEEAIPVNIEPGMTVSGINGPLQLDPNRGTVSGTLTEAGTGAKVTSAWVGLLVEEEGDWYWTGDGAPVDESGYFEFDAPAGQYVLGYQTWDVYVTEYWNNATDPTLATPLTIEAFGSYPNKDAALTPNYGTVTGSVTDEDTSLGIGYAYVTAWYYDEFWSEWLEWNSIQAEETGAYSLRLPAGQTFKLSFGDDGLHYPEYWENAETAESGADVSVALGQTLVRNAALTPQPPSISGQVLEEGTLAKIQYAWVDALYSDGEGGWYTPAWAETDANGAYALSGLGEGEYLVRFQSWDHVTEYYDNQAAAELATPVETNAEATVSGIDAELTPRGKATIEGTVLGADTGEGVFDISVDVYYLADWGWEGWDWTSTAYNGSYSIDVQSERTYALGFSDWSDRYISEYFDDAAALEEATEIPLADDEVFTADVVLAKYARISGTIVDDVTLKPIQGATAVVHRYTGEGLDWEYGYASDAANVLGKYSIPLTPGVYKVQFFGPNGTYLSEYWEETDDELAATEITVLEDEQFAGVNGTLTPDFGTISGVLTEDGTGDPIQTGFVTLWAYDGDMEEWFEWDGVETGEDGSFSLRAGTGTYKLSFDDYTGRHAAEFYDDQPTIDGAADVTVAADDELTRNAALAPVEPSIIGNVVDAATLDPIPYPTVEAYGYDEENDSWYVETWADSDEVGAYQFWGLGTGSYAIAFSAGGYVTSFYDGKPDLDAADMVDTTEGETVANIDGALESRGSGTIEGHVTGADTELGVAGVEVSAFIEMDDGWEWFGFDYTDNSGAYRMQIEAQRDYFLEFWDYGGDYLPEYYDDVNVPWEATAITLMPDDVIVADAVLTKAATISGTVTDGSAPLLGIDAIAYAWDDEYGWEEFWYDTTDDSGSYSINGLPAGSYRVAFVDENDGTHVTEYWNDSPDIDGADDIVLDVSEDKTGIDAALAPAGRILGRVTDMSGAGIGEIMVEALVSDGFGGWDLAGLAWTDDNGDYLVGGLPTDSYRIRFSDGWYFARYIEEYYDDVSDILFASDVGVVAGTDAILTDASLGSTGAWGGISGQVRDAESGLPLTAEVELLYPTDWGWESFEYTLAESDGTYEFEFVANGDYVVAAYAWGAAYDVGYHLDAPAIDSADIVTVDSSDVTDVDVLLTPSEGAGRIYGTVYAADGVTPIPGALVQFYKYYEDEEYQGWEYAGETLAGESGEYDVAQYPGDYKIRFIAPPYASEWFDDAGSMGAATIVPLAEGGTELVDATLDVGGSIGGTFTGALPNAWLEARLWRQVGAEFELFEDWTVTLDWGTDYSFEGLPMGTYRLEYRGWGPGTVYAQTFWGGAYTLDEAADIVIDLGDPNVTANPELEAGAVIYADVATDEGPAEWPMMLTLWRNDGSGFAFYREEKVWPEEGGYWFDNLPAGQYRLQASDPIEGLYDDVWYSDAIDLASATDIVLEAGDEPSVQVTLDGLPPVLADDIVTPYENTATIHLSATDAVIGVQSISYRLDNAPSATTVAGDSATLSGIGVGNHTLTYSAVDRFGHMAYKIVGFAVLDTQAPVPGDDAEIAYENGGTIHMFGTDAVGVTKIEYKFDNSLSWTTANAATANAAVPWGATSLTYKVFDAAGNNASKTVNFEVSDTVAPTVTKDNKGTYYGSAAVKITASDAFSGPKEIRYQVGAEATVTVSGPIATVTKSVVGTYPVKYVAYDNAGNTTEGQFTFNVVPGVLTTVPLQGENRYETAIKIATEAFNSAETAVLATGENWPDALGGAALARAYDGPILLVKTHALPSEVLAALTQLGVKDVIVLGGKAAVGSEVESALKAKGYGFTRLGGSNRFETSRIIASEVSKKMTDTFPAKAFVATGKNFPDALAGSPISAAKGWPIYLVGDTISGAEMNTIKAHGVKDLTILGGTGVVNGNVEKALLGQFGGAAHVRRIAGGNRYETAVKVAQLGVSECGLTWNKLALATGANFPDALAGGVLQGKDRSVMVLTPSTSLDKTVASVLTANKASIYEVRFLGGTSAIEKSVRDKVQAILKK